MKRTMIVMFALAMLLAWSGMAMAQSQLSEAAFRNCKTADRDDWFAAEIADATDALGTQVLLYPYFVSTGDWWSGMAIINTFEVGIGAAGNIPGNSLCVVAINDKGDSLFKRVTDNIYAGNMYVTLVENLDPEEAGWKERLAIGVFARNFDIANTIRGNIQGFGMIGNGTEGQGYFAYQDAAPAGRGLGRVGIQTGWFNYLPQGSGDWWRGVALFNNADDDAHLRVSAIHQDGSGAATTERDPLSIRRGEFAVDTFDNIIPGLKEDERARVRACITNRNDGSDCDLTQPGRFLGFTMFGNTKEAMGYLPQ